MTTKDPANTWSPRALAVLRIMTGLLFMQHGMQKWLHFPPFPGTPPTLPPLLLFGGVLEGIGGLLIVLGLLTRPVAFVLAGQMAVAYFLAHAPHNFFPVLNGGDSAIQYCFVFLYLVVSGAGAWSLDKALKLKWA
jgi:putative oxidoreductase